MGRGTADFALGKNVCGVHGLYTVYTAIREYAREQFRGSVRHINRDERKRRVTGKKQRGRERKGEKKRQIERDEGKEGE